MSDTCAGCGRTDLEVTVTFDRHDPVSILRVLKDAADPEALRIAAQAIMLDKP
jgi:predicted Fe-S protein YdhL (DUF1289 family)